MRWERLFADLEAQVAADDAIDFAYEVDEHARHAREQVDLMSRLRASRGIRLTVHTVDGEATSGVLRDAGQDWVVIQADLGWYLIGGWSICAVQGISEKAAPVHELDVTSRLPVISLLRRMAEAQVRVQAFVVDGSCIAGTITQLGKDYLALSPVASDFAREWPGDAGNAPARAGTAQGIYVALAKLARLRFSGEL